jgi:hypothetical protein
MEEEKLRVKLIYLVLSVMFLAACSSGESNNASTNESSSQGSSAMLTDDVCLDFAIYALEGMSLSAKAHGYLGEPTEDPVYGGRALFKGIDKGRRILSRVTAFVQESSLLNTSTGDDLISLATAFDNLTESWEKGDSAGIRDNLPTLERLSNELNQLSQNCSGK